MSRSQDSAVAVKQGIEHLTALWHNVEKSHPRYRLRTTALKAIMLGALTNFICLIIAMSHRWVNGPKHVTAWTTVTLGISFMYQVVDLFSTPKGTTAGLLFSKHIPAIYLLGVDTLGFLSFLALLIANGIVVADSCGTPMYIYNSVPWMVLCIIHGRIALSASVRALRDLVHAGGAAGEGYCCAECKKRASGKGDDDGEDASEQAEVAPLLTPQSGRSGTGRDPETGLV